MQVSPTGGLSIVNGILSVSATNSYVLPTASTTTLGGVKVDGTTITIANGVISSTGGSGGTVSGSNPTFTGNVTLNSLNSNLVIGAANLGNTTGSNIDFRVFGWATNTYDVRLNASGGVVNVNGQGALAITAAGGVSVNGVAFTPAAYAPLANPAFTGTPTAPTPASGAPAGQIATVGALNAQVSQAAVVTSLQGNGAAAAVMVSPSGAPSLQNSIFCPPWNIPAGQLVTGQVYSIIVPFAASLNQINAGLFNPGSGSVVVTFAANATPIAGLTNLTVTGTYTGYHATNNVALDGGIILTMTIGAITGTFNTVSILNVQAFPTYA